MKIFKNSNLNGIWYSTTFYHKYNADEIKRYVQCDFPKQNLLPNEANGSIDFDLIARDKTTGKEYNVMLSAFRRASGEAEPKLVFFERKEKDIVSYEQKPNTENLVNEFIEDNNVPKFGNVEVEPDDLPFY